MSEPRILITGTGGPSGISILKDLAGGPYELFSGDIDPYATGLYLVPEAQRMLLPRGDDPEFVDKVIRICEQLHIDLLIPTVDTELLPLAKRLKDLEAVGTKTVIASRETLEVCLDKWELHKRCVGQVRVPETVVVDDEFDPAGIRLPVIVKPRTGSGSRGIRLIKEVADLKTLERDGSLMAQELLPGPEFSIDVFADCSGEVRAVVPRERLKVDSGIAITGRTTHDESLEQFGADVARLIGLTTVANVQAKEAVEGVPGLLEVNPRFPGTMPLTIASGVDMPKLAVDEALGHDLPPSPIPFRDVAMVRHFDEHIFDFSEIEKMVGKAR
ncbi:MAG: ATP-grasp domain-containing protein [Actinomycetota bacterium]|nr:ATP-grasp domain-containing protein [Actinomycetota bacterium]